MYFHVYAFLRCFLAKGKRTHALVKKLNVLPHDFTLHLLEQGVSLRNIQTLLGHGNSKTTELYMHISKKSLVNIKSPLDQLIEY